MSKYLKLSILIILSSMSIVHGNIFEDYGITWFTPEVDRKNAVEDELSGPGGMIYSVPKTVK